MLLFMLPVPFSVLIICVAVPTHVSHPLLPVRPGVLATDLFVCALGGSQLFPRFMPTHLIVCFSL